MLSFFKMYHRFICTASQFCAQKLKLPLRLCVPLPSLGWGRTDSLDVGYVAVGRERLSVSFSLPYGHGHTDSKQAMVMVACACSSKHRGRRRHTLLLAVTWPSGLCSTSPGHISPAGLAPQTTQRSNVPSTPQERRSAWLLRQCRKSKMLVSA